MNFNFLNLVKAFKNHFEEINKMSKTWDTCWTGGGTYLPPPHFFFSEKSTYLKKKNEFSQLKKDCSSKIKRNSSIG
jgi:hypothetical protein